jgi:hypothetical protein
VRSSADQFVGAGALLLRRLVPPDDAARAVRLLLLNAEDGQAVGDEARVGFVVVDSDGIELVTRQRAYLFEASKEHDLISVARTGRRRRS